ncbi:hypothetical protein FVR03_02965 [Pontibacter qinzhouensis]|uniref:STAS/SEC14 domain-containing protein n=1 Tax=Pontibacter qinzhouensis TaxID=2603253 RepID=A0A5C8KAH4_9BACT|nr:hypothetical protein [Pontibacter qinzhouensis]TXK51910.1 hypothetical protein FVR03_02965 [Pontibacter qinzhouensis]
MRNELLFRESYIAIEYNEADDWIYVNWRGFVNYETVTAGCEKILFFMQEKGCNKILNDNTNVEGIWSGASKWVGQEWFPRMVAAGMLNFAWVYSSSAFSRLSADKALKNTDDLNPIRTFDNIDSAQDWLRSV